MIQIKNFIRQQAITLLAALFGLLLLLTFIYGLRQWHSDWRITHQPAETTHVSIKSGSADMISAIPNDHIFGQNISGGEDAPVTNLELRVTGIVKTGNNGGSSESKAYISISGQPSKIYQIGDSLPYGVKVYDITPDTVILENDGHLEKLPLPREKLQFKAREQ